jgi:hypothetical protein
MREEEMPSAIRRGEDKEEEKLARVEEMSLPLPFASAAAAAVRCGGEARAKQRR